MHIPVLKKKSDGSTELIQLDLEDVIYICVENRNLVYHTQDESYFHISTLTDLKEHLSSFQFYLTDKTNLVNFKKIKKIEQKQGKIYFQDKPNSSDKYATIAFMKQKMYKNKIMRAIAENTNTSLEFSLKDQKDEQRLTQLKEQKE